MRIVPHCYPPPELAMPTRIQQLGLLILLTALIAYVLIRVEW